MGADFLPLAGIRVADLSRLLPGPYCTSYLRELGAEVVKIEDPVQGDYLRSLSLAGEERGRLFSLLNQGKKSVAIDLKAPPGRELFLGLLPSFDLLVESFRPGVMERLGLGYPALQQRNAALVQLSITGYGQTGPLAGKAGHDLNYLARSGILSQNLDRTGIPLPLPVQLADVGGGALTGALAVVAALFESRATGRGRRIDLSMLEATTRLAPIMLSGGRQGVLSGSYPAYRSYQTADGEAVVVGALEEKFLKRFATLTNHPDWAELASASPERTQEIEREIAEFFAAKPRDDWRNLFEDPEACVDPVLNPAELSTQAAEFLTAQPEQGFTTPFPKPLAGGALAAPRLGENTAEILKSADRSSPSRLAGAEIFASARSGGAPIFLTACLTTTLQPIGISLSKVISG